MTIPRISFGRSGWPRIEGQSVRRDDADPIGITVVTIALNAASALPLTLESVIAQDYKNLEIVAIDGMSWDGSNRVLDRYTPHLHRIVVEEDAGIYYAMNKAVDLATKDFVIFMNAGDQFFSEDAISRMVRGTTNEADIFYGNHIYDYDRLELFKRAANFAVISERLAAGAVDGDWLESIPCHQATFTRTALLRQLRFDTRLRVSADHEFLFRAHEQGARMLYIDELVARYAGGGFSAVMGELTRLEGAWTYRRFSDRPDLVDKFFFPCSSPFNPETQRTGFKLTGFHPPRLGSAPAEWAGSGDHVAPDGCSFLSSAGGSAGLEFTGHNQLGEQAITLFADGEEIGSASMPPGSYRLRIDFVEPVTGATVITLRPSGNGPDATCDFGIRSFRFYGAGQEDADCLIPGQTIFFRHSTTSDFKAALGSGWSEPETTHLWSLGAMSELWLRASDQTQRLVFTISGNPHVEGGRQEIALLVNGTPVATGVAERGGVTQIELQCQEAAWRGGQVNRVEIWPDRISTPPPETGDTRQLGICMWRMEVV